MEVESMFEEVTEMPERVRRRGRISQPLFQQFLKSGLKAAKLKAAEVMPGRKPLNLMLVLRAYSVAHPELGVEIAMVNGEVYFLRAKDDEDDQDKGGKLTEGATV